jgi:uncharacterized repeat protein (TIGR03803 family)
MQNSYARVSRGVASLFALFAFGAARPVMATYTYTYSLIGQFDVTNGALPESGLTIDPSENIFGTTRYGGSSGQFFGGGTVFEVPAGSHTLTSVLTFDGAANGGYPAATLFSDAAGNLYGTTTTGGAGAGNGTVFEIAAGSHTLTTLASIDSIGTDPSTPALDPNGNLFGTTFYGPTGGNGTVFELPANGNSLTPIATVSGNTNTIISDAQGNLFGTIWNNSGGVFEISAASHQLSTIASFGGNLGSDTDCLTMDSAGNLYGINAGGGSGGNGNVFKIDAQSHAVTILGSFDGTTAIRQIRWQLIPKETFSEPPIGAESRAGEFFQRLWHSL